MGRLEIESAQVLRARCAAGVSRIRTREVASILTAEREPLKILISQKLCVIYLGRPEPKDGSIRSNLRNHKYFNMLRLRTSVCIVLCLSLPSFISGCRQNLSTEHPESPKAAYEPFAGNYPMKVVCTTGPVADILRNVGGDHVDVAALMGPGVDPHLYKAVPSDIEQLDSADAVFYNGLHLEGRMADQFEQLARRKPTFAVTHSLVESKDKRLRTPPEFAGHYDPHVWHDPKMWSECVKYVGDVLAEFDPKHRDDYMRNRDAYLKQVDEADQYCRDQLAAIPAEQRVLVTAHDAFGYFCTAYGLTSMPLKGVSTEEEVTIGRMDEVIDFLVKKNIKAVFVESATAPQIVKALIEPCRKAGHEVKIGGELYADALGSADSGADTYLGMIKANIDTIVKAMK
jgi:manganese/zinc/iron transport system substrate-binding protein